MRGFTRVAVTATAALVLVSCTETVYEVIPVSRVEVTGMPAQIEAGQSVQLSARVDGASGKSLSGRSITWSSSNSSVATVSADGRLTALTAGPVTVQATCEGVSGSANTTVTPPPVASVSVEPATATIQVGGLVQLQATPRAADGSALPDRPVTWQSSSAAIATVDGTGLVTGVAPGAVTITATSEGRSGTAQVTVESRVGSVTVTPTGHRMNVGWRWGFEATVRDPQGAVMTDLTPTWSSSNTGAATVDAVGLVRGVGGGSAQIRATAEGVVGATTVAISADPCSAITVWPPQTTVNSSLHGTGCLFWADGSVSEFFSFEAEAQLSMVAPMNSTAFRPAVGLHRADAADTRIRYYAHAAAPAGGSSVTKRVLVGPGRYHLETNAWDAGTGAYTFSIPWGSADPVITNCELWLVVPSIDYRGTISTTDCVIRGDGLEWYADEFRVVLTSQERVTINMSSAALDSFLFLIGPTGEVVATDDDSGGGLNARIVFTAPSRGIYRVLAVGGRARETGPYRLQIETTGGSAEPAVLAPELAPPHGISTMLDRAGQVLQEQASRRK